MLASINTLHPSATRTRSNTALSANIPNDNANTNDNDAPQSQTEAAAPRIRPGHFRSRSYISPIDSKARFSLTLPTDSVGGTGSDRDKDKNESSLLHWKHLPGHRRPTGSEDERNSHGHLHVHRRTHRHTRSELPSQLRAATRTYTGEDNGVRKTGDDNNDSLLHPNAANPKAGMLTRISTNLSNRNPHTHTHAQPRSNHQYSTSDFSKTWNHAVPGSTATGGLRPDLRRRATSDPKSPGLRFSPASNIQFIGYGGGGGVALHGYGRYEQLYNSQLQPDRKPMTEVEILLYKAEKARREAEKNATDADVQWLTTQLAESNVELQAQLATNKRTALDLTRRLDEAHDALLSAASSLSDTISSFQNLVTQSKTLIVNFDQRAKELDTETRKALNKRKKELFDARGEQVAKLEERGRKANKKAEELSQRLENCRTIVRNYQEREQTKRKAWKGVLMGSLWGITLIVLGLMLGFGLWWWKNYNEIVKYDVHEAMALTFDRGGLAHPHDGVRMAGKELDLNDTDTLRVLDKVPADVKAVLRDIADRHDAARHPIRAGQDVKTQQYVVPSSEAEVEDDKKLKKLFERLEL